MIMNIKKSIDSSFELYCNVLLINNVVRNWGISDTHVKILAYLMIHGYNKITFDLICSELNMSEKSLRTNMSYLRTGRIGSKRTMPLLQISKYHHNISELSEELLIIKKFVESGDELKACTITFETN